MFENSKILMSPKQLCSAMDEPNVVLLDTSWHLPTDNTSALSEYHLAHIEGAHFFDIDEFSDPNHSCPHMLPNEKDFSEKVTELGIGKDTDLILYDSKGLFSSPRVWWMFKTFGHHSVGILDGGLPAWREFGGGLTGASSPIAKPDVSFEARFDSNLVVDKDTVRQCLNESTAIVLDARSRNRFMGLEKEPRANVRRGHMPGARNLHYSNLLSNPIPTLKSKSELEDLFGSLGIKRGSAIITTCGSGITACIVALALYQLGWTSVSVYDGSWADWGSDPNCPVEKDVA